MASAEKETTASGTEVTDSAAVAPPHVNGVIDGIEEDERLKIRPADIDAVRNLLFASMNEMDSCDKCQTELARVVFIIMLHDCDYYSDIRKIKNI